MPLAITNSGKLGLGIVAGLFILFALAVSMWVPRRSPDFPGDRLGAFIGVALLLFVATVAGVVVFAKEEAEGHGGNEAAETHAATETGESGGETQPATTGGETETGEGEGEDGSGGEGDAEAGEQVYAANGCGGCHALEAAGSSGNVGPNLDEADPSFEAAVETITNGRGAMPAFGDRLEEQQIRDVAAFVTGG